MNNENLDEILKKVKETQPEIYSRLLSFKDKLKASQAKHEENFRAFAPLMAKKIEKVAKSMALELGIEGSLIAQEHGNAVANRFALGVLVYLCHLLNESDHSDLVDEFLGSAHEHLSEIKNFTSKGE